MSTYLPAALSIVALWPAAAIAAWLIAEFAPAGNAPASPPRTVRQVMLTATAAGLATLPCDLTLQQRLWLLPAATLLIALALIDWRHQRLPDRLTQPLLWAGLLCNLNQEWVPLSDALLGAVAGYLSLWLLDALYRRARRRAGIGQGDFKLLAALGAWVGWGALPLLVSVAAAAGLCVTLARSPPGKMAWRAPLPFGVYLAAAGWLTLLLSAGAHYA